MHIKRTPGVSGPKPADWGLGSGVWGSLIPNPQPLTPNPQTPTPAILLLMTKAACLLLAALPAFADKPFEFLPGASYDPHIPTMRKVLGYEPGDQITTHAGIVRYLSALAAASGKLRVFDYAESWEGRKLVYAAVGSEA